MGSLFLTTGDTSKVSSTIIDGSNGWGIDINNSSSGTIQSTTKISGLTIKNGNAQSSSSGHGAGVRVFFYDEVLIDRCVIRDNRDYAGSGISVVENVNTVKVTNSKIISNENYGGNGAGINVGMNFYSNIGRFEIRNSIIADNTGANDGGGICSYAETTIIANCTITGNEAGWASGVCFYNAGGDSALLLNSIISQNSTGGSISNTQFYQDENGGPVVLKNNYSNDFQFNIARSSGNVISLADPFVNRTNGDFSLKSSSPAIGGGTASIRFE